MTNDERLGQTQSRSRRTTPSAASRRRDPSRKKRKNHNCPTHNIVVSRTVGPLGVRPATRSTARWSPSGAAISSARCIRGDSCPWW